MKAFTTRKGTTYHPLTPERQQLAESCMNFAKKLAHQFSVRHGEDFDECFSAATEGLCRAAALFDFGLGFKFSTYCSRWILWAMQYQRMRMMPFGARGPQAKLPGITPIINERHARVHQMPAGELFDHLAAGLTGTERTAARMYWLDGMEQAEVRERLGWSRNKVYWTLKCARIKMRERLEVLR